jgi:hypothetical protein
MPVEPRAVRRKIRRVFRVRTWPWRTKVAVGAWVPAIIVAAALFTGPNRPASGADASNTTPTTRNIPKVVTPKLPTPSTVPLEVALGAWIKGIHGHSPLPAYIRIARQQKAPRILGTHPGSGPAQRHQHNP